MRLHGFTGKDVTKELGAFVTDPPGLYFYRDVGVAIFTWHELRAAVGYDFGNKPVTTHYHSVEEFLHHEMPTFDMTEPSKEQYPDDQERAKAWKKKKAAARRKFYDDVDKLAAVGLAHRSKDGDVHLGMGARGDEIAAERARREAKRAARRGEVPSTETTAPVTKKVEPKALAEGTAPVVTIAQEVVTADDARERKAEVHALHSNSEATQKARRHGRKKLQKQIHKDEAGLRRWEEGKRLKAEQEKEERNLTNRQNDEMSAAGEEGKYESIAVSVRMQSEKNPTEGMSWVERNRYELEQERIKAATQEEEPFFGGLLDPSDEEEEESWLEPGEVSEDELW